jgi:hypothetical protein
MGLPKNENGTNNWIEYRALVLDKLDNLDERSDGLLEEQIKIRLDIRELKVRAAVWGGVSGGLIVLAGIVLRYVLGL